MTDKQTKRVILKDPVSGATLYPDIGVSIPTKTSDITNDSGFITSSDIPAIPEDLSDLNNDVGFITGISWDEVTSKPSTFTPAKHSHTVSEISDFPTIPSNTSDLNNDSGFITSLPTASDKVAGVIKVGTGLTITNGVLNADAPVITVDSAISGTSANPVQNKVIKSALDGKQSSITSSNKLDADLIDDSESTNKLATSAQLTAISTNTSAITAINNTLSGYGNIVTHNASEFAGSSHTHSQYLTSVAWTDISGRPDVNTGKITIQKNGTKVDDFTVNDANNKTINITVPTSAADISALPDSTDYGASIDLSIDEDYVITATLKDQNGDTLSTGTIDLPLESVVVSGSYNKTNKKVVLTLQNGSTVDFSVADLVSGLQSEITSSNKLSADLISDGTTNKIVTQTEKNTWNNKQNALNSTQINNIAKGGSALQPEDVDSALNSTSENPVQNKVVTSALNGKANDSDVVHKTGNETKSGTMTFNGKVTAAGDLLVGNSNTQHEGGQIDFAKCSNSSLKSNIFIDQYDDGLRFFCTNSSNQVSMPLQIEFNVGYALGNTPATSDNSKKLATTEYVKNQGYTSNTGTITGITMNGSSKGTSGVIDLGTVLTAHQDISGKANISDLATVATSGDYNDLDNLPTIPAAQVNADWNATSGKAQILNKPTIPSAVTESTVSGWGFTKNAGTITGIKMNGASKGTSGVVDLGIVKTESDVFIATYGTTTFSDITNALNAGKVVYCKYNETSTLPVYATYVGTSNNVLHIFEYLNGNTYRTLNVTSADSWTSNTSTYATTSAISDMATKTWVGNQGFITSVAWGDVTGKPSSFTPSSHNQASNTINALTSYSKSVSGGTGALSTSDTLNKALAKLENALDGKQASGSYAAATHTHTKSQITDFPTIPTITDTYSATSSNGMSGKAVASAISGVTPASIGAATSSHTHSEYQSATTAVKHTASTSVGSATKGVYIASDGTATAMTYSVEKDVPSNAVFTDTNTLMTQSASSSNNTYPILLCPTANATADQGAKAGIFASGVKVNPSTGIITASTPASTSTNTDTSVTNVAFVDGMIDSIKSLLDAESAVEGTYSGGVAGSYTPYHLDKSYGSGTNWNPIT